jgi:hypothetical protein
MCAQAAIFSAKKKVPQKMREVYILCLEGGLVSPKWVWITGCRGEFFHEIKVRQPIGKNDSIQAVCKRMI